MPPFRRLFATFLPLGLLLSQSSPAHVDGLAISDLTVSTAPLFRLFKRRRGGGDGESDSSSGSGGSGGSSSGSDDDDDDDDDDDSGGGCTGPTEMCSYSRRGYGKWYEAGPGLWNSTEGGFTPEGSGTAPRWLVRNGQWEYIYGFENEDEAKEGDGWYFGGAWEPFTSGDPSPSGIEPVELDLDNPGNHTPDIPPGMNATHSAELWYSASKYETACDLETLLWAYKYPTSANLIYRATRLPETTYATEIVNVYCVCSRDSVCGCDEPEPSRNFTGALMNQTHGAYTLANSHNTRVLNLTNVCDVHLNGEHAFLVQGTLDKGSTKADPDMERTSETSESMYAAPCPGSCPPSAASLTPLAPSAWTVVMIAGIVSVRGAL